MGQYLVCTGLTGGKSGGELAQNIAKNIEIIKGLFPDGIKAVCRKTSNTTKLERMIPNIEIDRGSFNDVDFLVRAFNGADTVLHLVGIHWSREVVTAAVKCNIRRLILVHTTGIYSKYKEAGKEYREIEEFVYAKCKENGIILTICRPTMIYGNTLDNNVVEFIKMVDKFPIMPVVNGANYELQPVHYSDLGKAYYQILVNEEKTANKDYILSGASPVSLRTMLEEIGKNIGKRVKFISCPYWIAYPGACLIYWISLKKVDYREKVQRLCEPRAFSHDEATKDFGYEPMSFEQGIKNEVQEYLRKKR